MFGGWNTNGRQDDVWEWDGENKNWSGPFAPGVSGAHRPSARDVHALAYDSARGRVVLFGGVAAGGRQDDVWVWYV